MKNLFLASVLILLVSACGEEAPAAKVQSEIAGQPYSQLLVYPQKTALTGFELSSHDGKQFDQNGFYGHWNLIFMGYTNCPDVCPTTLMDLTRIYNQIAPELQSLFQVIFLSVDPARDTLPHLSDYVSYFNEDFVGITGEKAQIDILVSALGGLYSINHEDEKFYSVDHSARIFIVNPKGERFGIIKSEAMSNPDKSVLVAELTQLVQQ